MDKSVSAETLQLAQQALRKIQAPKLTSDSNSNTNTNTNSNVVVQQDQAEAGSMVNLQLESGWTTSTEWKNGHKVEHGGDAPTTSADTKTVAATPLRMPISAVSTSTAATATATSTARSEAMAQAQAPMTLERTRALYNNIPFGRWIQSREQATGGFGGPQSSRQSSANSNDARKNSASNEAHSVPGMFLLWVSFFLWGLGRNVSGSNSSASGMPPNTVAQLSQESSGASSSLGDGKGHRMTVTGQGGNSSTMLSCSSGNFFFGFAVVSLMLGVLFAPVNAATKLWALTAIQAATGVSLTQVFADVEQSRTADYTEPVAVRSEHSNNAN